MAVMQLPALTAPQDKLKFMVALPVVVMLAVLEIPVSLVSLLPLDNMCILVVMEDTDVTEQREEAVPLVYQPQVV
jgi:hypothetical protein